MDDVRVKVIRVSDEPDVGQTSFNLSIELIGLLSQRETILLYNSARNCEVHKLMTGKMEFNYYLLHEEE